MEQAFRLLYPKRRRLVDPGWFRRLERRARRDPIRMGAGVAQVVGNNAGFNATATASVSVTLTVSAGSSLVVFATWGTSTTAQGDAATCTDSQSGIYQDGEYLQFTAITQSGAKFFRENVSAGSITVTVTFVSGTAAFNAIYVAEVTGSAGIIDATNAQQQGTVSTSANAISAGPMYSSGAPGLIVGFTMSMNAVATPSAGTGFTQDLSDPTVFVCFEHQRITTAAPTSVTPTFTTSNGTAADLFTGGYYILESTPSTIYVKQRRRANGTSAATTLAITLNVTSGSVLHVYTNGDFSTGLTISVADPTNGTYTTLDTVHDSTVDNVLLQQSNVANTASGSLTITVTYSASTSSRSVCVVEILNQTSATPEAHTSNNQTPSVTTTDGTTSGSVSIVNPGMILGMSAFLSATSTDLGTVGGNQGTNFAGGLTIFQGEVSNFHGVAENKLNSSAGSVAATFTALTTEGAVSFIAYYDGNTGGQPTINTQPANVVVYNGQPATWSVSATASPGGGSLSYAWTFNGGSVGTNASSYTRNPTAMADNGGIVQVTVTDSNGSTLSAPALLTVLVVPPSAAPGGGGLIGGRDGGRRVAA